MLSKRMYLLLAALIALALVLGACGASEEEAAPEGGEAGGGEAKDMVKVAYIYIGQPGDLESFRQGKTTTEKQYYSPGQCTDNLAISDALKRLPCLRRYDTEHECGNDGNGAIIDEVWMD